MMRPDQLKPLHCMGKVFLVSHESGDRVPYALVGLFVFCGRLGAVLLGTWSLKLGFVVNGLHVSQPYSTMEMCEIFEEVNLILLLCKILFKSGHCCCCDPAVNVYLAAAIFGKHGAQVLESVDLRSCGSWLCLVRGCGPRLCSCQL